MTSSAANIKPALNRLLFFFLCSIALSASAAQGQNRTIGAFINGAYQQIAVTHFQDDREVHYVNLDDLANALNLQTYHSNRLRKATLYVGALEIKISALNPFVVIGDRTVQMPIEARYADGNMYVPMPYFLQIIEPYYSGSVRLTSFNANGKPSSAAAALLAANDDDTPPIDVAPPPPVKVVPSFNLLNIDVEEKANGTLIRIKTSKEFDPSHINSRVTRGWLYVDIYGGLIDTTVARRNFDKGTISKIVPLQLKQMAQLSFQLRSELASRKIYTDNATNEILVSLTTQARISPDLLQSLENERKKWLIDTIIIDPGHGGRDPGAIGPGNIYEKDVTLDIGRQLKKLLVENTDIRVIMTREDDRFVPLRDRTKLANREQGKLFISIHANSNRNRNVHGLTTYFLGPARTEEALEVAKRENAVISYERDQSSYQEFENEEFILLSLAQNAYQLESEEFAALVQDYVSRQVGIKDRGVKQAGYYVLIGASMPNVLVEVAFISNKREAELLSSSRFRKKVAEGLFQSVMQFKQKYEQGIQP